jgi:hypothetical protein
LSLDIQTLFAGLSPRRSGFILKYFHVRFMVDEVAVGQCYHIDLISSAVSIIPKMFHTHLLLQGDLTGRTKGLGLRTFQSAMNGLSEIENHSTEKYFHLAFIGVISRSTLPLLSKTLFWRIWCYHKTTLIAHSGQWILLPYFYDRYMFCGLVLRYEITLSVSDYSFFSFRLCPIRGKGVHYYGHSYRICCEDWTQMKMVLCLAKWRVGSSWCEALRSATTELTN